MVGYTAEEMLTKAYWRPLTEEKLVALLRDRTLAKLGVIPEEIMEHVGHRRAFKSRKTRAFGKLAGFTGRVIEARPRPRGRWAYLVETESDRRYGAYEELAIVRNERKRLKKLRKTAAPEDDAVARLRAKLRAAMESA